MGALDIAAALGRRPFEPFRIRLVNGDFHNVGYPLSMALLSAGVYIASQDGHWTVFPLTSIASIESLISFESASEND